MIDDKKLSWVFFGTSRFSVIVLDELKSKGLTPKLIVTTEDKPKGRKLVLTPPEAKIWAEKEKVDFLQLKNLKNTESFEKIKSFGEFDFFLVASYGKIIPENILEIPKNKTLNIHPSLLPKLRGASPIQSAILNEDKTGVTIIKLDPEMDHGPILMQKELNIEWPPYAEKLEEESAILGSSMILEILPSLMKKEMEEKEQDHSEATFCEKIKKSDAEIKLEDNPETNLRKIRAYHLWPGAFFFLDNKRIIIKKARIDENKLVIERIVPEGKKEMNYEDFIRNRKL